MSVAALINGINASSTCNCDSVPVYVHRRRALCRLRNAAVKQQAPHVASLTATCQRSMAVLMCVFVYNVRRACVCSCSGSTCGCNLSHQVTGPPCSGTDFVKWTLVKSTQYALPKAWADQQVVKVEGFCNAAGSSTQWAQADVSSAAVIKAAITGLINAMPKGTCYSDGP